MYVEVNYRMNGVAKTDPSAMLLTQMNKNLMWSQTNYRTDVLFVKYWHTRINANWAY